MTVEEPQIIWSAPALTTANAFTEKVKLIGFPKHPFAFGVTEIVPFCCVEPAFNPTNDAIEPEPDAANPMVEFVFVQSKVVFKTGLVKFTTLELEFTQIT